MILCTFVESPMSAIKQAESLNIYSCRVQTRLHALGTGKTAVWLQIPKCLILPIDFPPISLLSLSLSLPNAVFIKAGETLAVSPTLSPITEETLEILTNGIKWSRNEGGYCQLHPLMVMKQPSPGMTGRSTHLDVGDNNDDDDGVKDMGVIIYISTHITQWHSI